MNVDSEIGVEETVFIVVLMLQALKTKPVVLQSNQYLQAGQENLLLMHLSLKETIYVTLH
jgi:hypothetical protein